jgi:hypothetical protein
MHVCAVAFVTNSLHLFLGVCRGVGEAEFECVGVAGEERRDVNAVRDVHIVALEDLLAV